MVAGAAPAGCALPAVRDGDLHEIKSSVILQPGPAAVTDGLDALHTNHRASGPPRREPVIGSPQGPPGCFRNRAARLLCRRLIDGSLKLPHIRRGRLYAGPGMQARGRLRIDLPVLTTWNVSPSITVSQRNMRTRSGAGPST